LKIPAGWKVGVFSQVFRQNRLFNRKCPCLGVKIRHNVTTQPVKYATTMKAAWHVKFVGFNQKNISNIRRIVIENI
jgi:hypothetical protein